MTSLSMAKDKKKGKKDKGTKEQNSGSAEDQTESQTLEYYQVKIADLSEKHDRM